MTDEVKKPNPKNYQPNSKKSKQASEGKDGEKPQQQAIVNSVATLRKPPLGRRIAETFAGDNAHNVGQYILFDVVLPAIKDLLYDSFTKGLERTLFGTVEPRNRGRRSREVSPRYDKIYPGRNFEDDGSSRSISRRARATHKFDDIIVETREEANNVIDHLVMLVEEYDVATVNDLYDLVGITGSYVDDKWGWTDLRDARVVRDRHGFLLDLPKPDYMD